MISKEYGKVVVYCDCCGEELGTFSSFEEAIEAEKESDWTAEKKNGEWYNYCIECQ